MLAATPGWCLHLTSPQFIKGARIDFVDDLMGAAFKWENPNATASCGCWREFLG